MTLDNQWHLSRIREILGHRQHILQCILRSTFLKIIMHLSGAKSKRSAEAEDASAAKNCLAISERLGNSLACCFHQCKISWSCPKGVWRGISGKRKYRSTSSQSPTRGSPTTSSGVDLAVKFIKKFANPALTTAFSWWHNKIRCQATKS